MSTFYSRRFLLDSLYQPLPPTTAVAPPSPITTRSPIDPYTGDNSFDANVVMVLSVLLCALICSLGLNSIIRCGLRCSGLLSGRNTAARVANTGVKRKALKTFPTVSYTTELNLPGLDTECAICLSEFTNGERVRLLPKCNHGFHVRCIDRWLSSHSSCPTCRHCLVETCQKIVGCSSSSGLASTSESRTHAPPHESVVSIAPLEPESLIRDYR